MLTRKDIKTEVDESQARHVTVRSTMLATTRDLIPIDLIELAIPGVIEAHRTLNESALLQLVYGDHCTVIANAVTAIQIGDTEGAIKMLQDLIYRTYA